jgi:hypothetical protein
MASRKGDPLYVGSFCTARLVSGALSLSTVFRRIGIGNPCCIGARVYEARSHLSCTRQVLHGGLFSNLRL